MYLLRLFRIMWLILEKILSTDEKNVISLSQVGCSLYVKSSWLAIHFILEASLLFGRLDVIFKCESGVSFSVCFMKPRCPRFGAYIFIIAIFSCELFLYCQVVARHSYSDWLWLEIYFIGYKNHHSSSFSASLCLVTLFATLTLMFWMSFLVL